MSKKTYIYMYEESFIKAHKDSSNIKKAVIPSGKIVKRNLIQDTVPAVKISKSSSVIIFLDSDVLIADPRLIDNLNVKLKYMSTLVSSISIIFQYHYFETELINNSNVTSLRELYKVFIPKEKMISLEIL